MTLGMRGHAGAAGARQDLAAEADPEIRHAAVEHALGVLGLVADAGEAVVVVGAHRSAEHHHRGSEEHTSELQSLMRNSYAVFCLKQKNITTTYYTKKRERTNTNSTST